MDFCLRALGEQEPGLQLVIWAAFPEIASDSQALWDQLKQYKNNSNMQKLRFTFFWLVYLREVVIEKGIYLKISWAQ